MAVVVDTAGEEAGTEDGTTGVMTIAVPAATAAAAAVPGLNTYMYRECQPALV